MLPVVSGPEADALMGELRSLMESKAQSRSRQNRWPGRCPADSTVGQSPLDEPPPRPRQRCLAEEAEEVLLIFLRCSG